MWRWADQEGAHHALSLPLSFAHLVISNDLSLPGSSRICCVHSRALQGDDEVPRWPLSLDAKGPCTGAVEVTEKLTRAQWSQRGEALKVVAS